MAELLLYHHAQGQTPGFLAFADELRAAGHTVHAPDLYDGNTFAELDDGVGYAKQGGFDTILERGRLAAEGLPNELVYGGFSLGVMPAQMLAQTRPGAKGGLAVQRCLPSLRVRRLVAAGRPAPDPHDGGRRVGAGGSSRSSRARRDDRGRGAVPVPRDRHLFADSSLPDYDEAAATLLEQRVLSFLANVA